MDLKTGEIVELGEGINPVWSPDDSLIAYVYFNGIYVMKADGSENHRVVKYDVRKENDPYRFEVVPPLPNWSPGNQFLLYHKCINTCSSPSNISIYKVNVGDGYEEKIYDGGQYPYWRVNEETLLISTLALRVMVRGESG